MEENAKTEQYLSEEQLQAITGAGKCAQCEPYYNEIDYHNRKTTYLTNLLDTIRAEAERDPNKLFRAAQVTEKASQHIGNAKQLLNQVQEYHKQGHPAALSF